MFQVFLTSPFVRASRVSLRGGNQAIPFLNFQALLLWIITISINLNIQALLLWIISINLNIQELTLRIITVNINHGTEVVFYSCKVHIESFDIQFWYIIFDWSCDCPIYKSIIFSRNLLKILFTLLRRLIVPRHPANPTS